MTGPQKIPGSNEKQYKECIGLKSGTKKSNLLRRMIKCRELYLFLLPAVVLIVVFNYIPMYGVTIAFKDFTPSQGIFGSPWVGLKHFERLFTLPKFQEILGNTITLSVLSLVINFPIPIVLALLINQIKGARMKKITQTITYMPHFISVVVIVGMIKVLISPTGGLYGGLAHLIGITDPVNILGKAELFKWVYVLSDVWQHAGWNSIIYIAALSSVDPKLYEAATVDGANRWHKIRHIDFPALIPTMIILLILSTGNILGVGFEKIYLLQNSLNVAVSEVISTYVYKIGLQSAQYSFSTAVGLFNTIINFIFLFVVNKISSKVSETSLW